MKGRSTRAADTRSWSSTFGATMLLAVCVFAVFAGALRNGFVSDDATLVRDRLPEYLHSFPFPRAFTQSFWKGASFDVPQAGHESKDYYRPLVTISYALDMVLYRERPFGYHLTNIILHFVSTTLVLLLLRQLGIPRGIALAGAAVFAAHPVHATSVVWIAGRTDLLATMYLLAALLLLGEHLRRTDEREAAPWSSWRLWVGLACYLAALFSKEVSLIFGGLLVLHAMMLRRASPRPLRARVPWREIGMVGLLTVAFMVFRAAVLGLPDFRPGYETATSAFRPGMLPAAYAYYWRVLFLPGTMHFYVPLTLPASAGDPRFLLAVLALLVQVGLAFHFLRKLPLVGYGISWVLVALLPVSHLVPLAFKQVVTEYWAYLPSVGYCVLLTALATAAVERGWTRGRGPGGDPAHLVAGGLAVIALAGAVQMQARSAIFRTEETMLLHTVKHYPAYTDAWVTLAAEYGGRGDLQRAQHYAREALRRDPRARGGWMNLGNYFSAKGEIDSARIAYNRELEYYPYKDDVRVNLSDLAIEEGDESEAARLFAEAIERYPEDRQILRRRAEDLIAPALDPRNTQPWSQRAPSLRLAAGSLRALQQATGQPDVSVSHQIARAELALGRWDRATQAADAALTLFPDESTVQVLRLLADVGRGDPAARDRAASSWRGAAPAAGAADAEQLAEYFRVGGRIDLALPFWRVLLRAGRIEPERLNHFAAALLKADTGTAAASGGSDGIPGPREQARRTWEMLLEERPDDPYALLNLGGMAFSGDRVRCRSYWQRFVAVHPDRPEAADLQNRLTDL